MFLKSTQHSRSLATATGLVNSMSKAPYRRTSKSILATLPFSRVYVQQLLSCAAQMFVVDMPPRDIN
jgi:hypothetical protein